MVALLSIFFFGRFFCGWGCHVIALQDACTWLLGKINIRPKPFRTRLLRWGPFLLAVYMFVWPSFRRSVIFPILANFRMPPPAWLGETAAFSGFTRNFIVQDFWATFPEWYIAVPFLLLCGFACVYFLGSKGFCTYGCPYGGFFAPIDRLSIGRIVVSDACEGCGHCTAACGSNVRVHEEVRDFGMIVDPGCMKCLDCVSVCPNDALSFSFAKPAILARPRSEKAKVAAKIRPPYDLSLTQDLAIFAIGLVLFYCFRGMLNSIPLLMAAGMASIGAFAAAKLWRLVREPNVRIQNLQLKLKGRIRPLGFLSAVAIMAYLVIAAWSGFIINSRFRADLIDAGIHVPFQTVFSPDYKPADSDKAGALRSIALFERTRPWSEGGVGWEFLPATKVRLAWLCAVAGNLSGAEKYLRQAVDTKTPQAEWVFGLARVYMLENKPAEMGKALYVEMVEKHPELHGVRLALAEMELRTGNGVKAIEICEQLLASKSAPLPVQRVRATEILIDAGIPGRALEVMEGAIKTSPAVPIYRAGYSRALFFAGKPQEAVPQMREAVKLEPDNMLFLRQLAEMLREVGDVPGATEADGKADALVNRPR